MNAQEHRKLAEGLLDQLVELGKMIEKKQDDIAMQPGMAEALRDLRDHTTALAQVHATLALVRDEGDVVNVYSAGTLQIPAIMWTADERDTPKMIVETLSVVQAALTVYEEETDASTDYLWSHRERIARLIEAAQKEIGQ